MTLPYSWGAQGVWAPTGEVGDINAVARSNKGDWVANERLLAVADDFGFVKLTRYPANLGVSNERSYRGHSARVTQCAFSCNDKYLVTTGGGDRYGPFPPLPHSASAIAHTPTDVYFLFQPGAFSCGAGKTRLGRLTDRTDRSRPRRYVLGLSQIWTLFTATYGVRTIYCRTGTRYRKCVYASVTATIRAPPSPPTVRALYENHPTLPTRD
jgi:hypothetical protein